MKGRAALPVLSGLVAVLGLVLLGSMPAAHAQGRVETTVDDDEPPNVLFIAVDDLHPQLESHGWPRMHTPNMDRLAAEGVRFTRHYVQAPTCGASRYSMLMSQRPRRARPSTYGNSAFELLDEPAEDRPPALPRHFRQNGYRTVSIGKVSHSPDGREHDKTTAPGATDDPEAPPQLPGSWDEVYGPRGPWETAWRAFFGYAGGKSRDRGKTPATESADVPDTGYPDGLTANMAVDELEELDGRDEPFFLAVGFYKPHLPFTAPQRYWDLYDRDRIGLAAHPSAPAGADPSVSLNSSGELFGGYGGVVQDNAVTGTEEARTLRHGYYAATSYADAQVGKVLGALERLGLKENTVVVLWGDHGWHLGNLGVWGKHTLYEFSLRSPLTVRAPGAETAQPAVRTPVESIDIYPTLAELSGLPIPETVHGTSLAPLLEAPRRATTGPDAPAAFSYWRWGGRWGKTVRTARYRLMRWTDPDGTPAQIELYDHRLDPHETETVAEEHPDVVRRLTRRLNKDGREE
jgi:arylsulfatase A-like enzyme